MPTAQIDTANHASPSTSPKPTPLESPFGSSAASHPAFSNDVPQLADQNGRLLGLNADINETLDSLHSVLGTFKQQTSKTELCYPLAKPLVAPSFRGMEMPPIEKAVALLHGAKCEFKDHVHLTFTNSS